jgi:hypothetical protein
LLGLNTGIKPGLNVSMSVGGGSMRRFLLDTGSTGLWVYPAAMGHYSKTRYAVTNSYGSSLVYEGILVYTTVDFGNGVVTGKVPVALVARATCLPNVKSCPATPNKHNCPGVKPGRNAEIRAFLSLPIATNFSCYLVDRGGSNSRTGGTRSGSDKRSS